MMWLKRFLVSVIALLMLAMTAIYLTPLDTYVPELERALEERMHEPVSIQHLRIAALPLPHLELLDVSFGGLERVTAKSVDAELDLSDLLSGRKLSLRIVIRDGMAAYAQVRKLAGLFSNAPAAANNMVVRELRFSRVGLVTQEMILGPAEGKLEFSQDGKLDRLWFAMDEQKITAELLPLPEQHFSVKMQAHAWVPPQFPQFPLDDLQVEGVLGKQDFVAQKFAVALRGIRSAGSGRVEFSDGWRLQATLDKVDGSLEQVMALLEKPVELTGAISVKGVIGGQADTLSALKDAFQFSGEVLVNHGTARIAAGLPHPLVFDQIKVRVAAQPGRLELRALEAKLYGGRLSGAASIDRKNALLAAKVAVNGIAMQPLVEALTNEVLFTGNMDGAAKFSMPLDELDRFPETFSLAGNFHLRNGTLTKVDLMQAASNLHKAYGKGGVTRFDDLTGLLAVDANGYHFRKLKMASGSLNAEGRIDLSHSLVLKGMLDADVKGTAGLVSMPLVVSGTLDKPVIRPSGSTLAGAAVGTAILGPGLGTAVGIRIGGFLNKLFGNDAKSSNREVMPRQLAKK